ncbi:MAG: c-type cytochrome [Sphingobacteriales bacterium]|nr:c-type cytochrome [Sphingobacteriales bacterium]
MKKQIGFIFFMGSLLALTNIFFIEKPADINTKAALGKKLFNEKLLSKDSSISCASCHKPAYAFADTMAFSLGIEGKHTLRNTPSVLNMKNRPYYFWDGRAGSLEQQALMPIENPDEMGLPIAIAVQRLNDNPLYKNLFLKIYKQNPSKENLASALAAFENTLETSNSKFDDWSNNLRKLSAEEEAGRQLFIGDKAKCFSCHSMEDFTDDGFKNIGLYNGKALNDAGHFNFKKDSANLGKFKTPGLRNVAVTAPYMHNGMFATLEAVVDYYNDPSKYVTHPINIDPSLSQPLGLTEKEKKSLVAFLKTLTDKAFVKK